MVRLNYTGRKIAGTKIGQTVSKDLRKRIPPGSASKAAAREPHVELDLSGKQLTDEGFALFVDDLIECIQYRDEEHPHGTVRLTDLSLRGNGLTTVSMAKLGPVIALSADTLSRLDISDNEIRVTNQAEREEWESFLGSFQGCFMLKKIGFGANKLGAGGFDVLARVYAKSDLNFIISHQNGQNQPKDGYGNGTNGTTAGMRGLSLSDKMESVSSGCATRDTPQKESEIQGTDTSHYASTRGLRSVPYLVYSNACSSSACAFHLWNMIMSHGSPDQLTRFLPAGKSMAPLEDGIDTCGIVYTPNDDIGDLGLRLLDLGVKYGERLSAWDEMESSASDEEADEENIITKREAKRRAQVEMGRVKNRLLLDIIKTDGMHSVDLWNVAFKMMTVARALLLDSEKRQVDDGEKASPDPPEEEIQNPAVLAPFSIKFAEEFPSLDIYSRKKEIKDNLKAPTPTLQREAKNQRSSSHSGTALTKIPSKAAHVDARRFGLPIELWGKIIANAIDGADILSGEQRIKVLRYASDWASIEQELRIKGGTEFEQQWKILSSMDCLSYKN